MKTEGILIHKDFRGEIIGYEFNEIKFNVLITNKNALRSGDYHLFIQYDLILKGEFEVTLRQDDRDVVMRKKENEFIIIPPNTPHLFKSLNDTVMIEWWNGPFETKYYKPYRELIERQLK